MIASTSSMPTVAHIVSDDQSFVDPATGAVVTEKTCSHCGLTKPLSFFYKKTRGRYGRQEWCKRCMAKKPPLSAADELKERADNQGDEDMARKKGMAATLSSPDTVHDGLASAAQDTVIGVATDAEEEPAAASAALISSEEVGGRVSFSAWTRSTASVLFATPDFAILRVQGTSAYTVHLSASASERVRHLANHLPAGAIQPNMIELVARVISDSLTSEGDILGYAYY